MKWFSYPSVSVGMIIITIYFLLFESPSEFSSFSYSVCQLSTKKLDRGNRMQVLDTSKPDDMGYNFTNFAESLRQNTFFKEQYESEMTIRAHFPSSAKYVLAARFPLPEIPVIVDLLDGTCLLGHCHEMIPGSSTWNPDAHIRDLINSIMLPCSLRWNPDNCTAMDLGSNFGLHTFTMLQHGARVLSVEPQTDLCVASRMSILANGWDKRSVVLCGGVAASADTAKDAKLKLNDGLHRYHGPKVLSQYRQPSFVPLYTIDSIVGGLPTGMYIQLVKIDTDSIDCAILDQVLMLIHQGKISVGSLILESWDGSCRNENTIGRLLSAFLEMGYTVYRTHITERSWNDDHQDTERKFGPIENMPNIFREQYCQRFNFNLWIMDKNLATPEAVAAVSRAYTQFQYFLTKDPFLLAGFVTSEQ